MATLKSKTTEHAKDRIAERIGVHKKSAEKLADAALLHGNKHSDFSGSFCKYLDSVFLQNGHANNMRIYSQHIFLFKGDLLITVWRVPNKYINAVNKANKKRKEKQTEPNA